MSEPKLGKDAQQNEFLTTILESLTHPFYVVDAHDYTIQLANPAAQMHSLLGQATCYALTHGRTSPCKTASHPCPLEEIKRTKRPVAVEHLHFDRHGNARNVEVHGYPLFDSEGHVVQIIEYTLDITQRKQAEEALRESEATARALLNAPTDVAALLDTRGFILDANETMAQRFGRHVNELVGLYSWDLLPPELAEHRKTYADQVIRTSEPVRFEDERQGTWFDNVFHPVLDAQGKVTKVAILARDITKRVRTEGALRESEERFRLAFENASIGMCLVDLDGRLTRVNSQMCEIFGYDQEELESMTVNDITHPEDLDISPTFIRRAVSGEAEYTQFEKRYFHNDGHVVWGLVSSSLVRDSQGAPSYFISHVQDITDRKQAEATFETLMHDLGERVKELNCLYGISRLSGRQGISLEEIFQGAVELIPPSWLHPEVTAARITLEGQEFKTEHFRKTEWRQASDVVVHGERAGTLEVCLLEERPPRDEGPFLKEEGYLIDAIAERLGRITERTRAQEALRESEARWRSVAENSPDHVLLLDPDLCIEYANYASPGLTAEELMGTPLYSYVPEAQQAEIKGILEKVLRTGEPTSYETDYGAPDGSTIYYESRVVPRMVGGEMVGLAVNARDISEHKRVEAALREAKEAAEAARREEQERRKDAERRRQIAESLADVLAALNSNQPLKQVLEFITFQARQLLGNQAVAVYRLAGEDGTPALQAAHGLPSECARAAGCFQGLDALQRAVSLRQPVAVPDLSVVPPDQAPKAGGLAVAEPCADLCQALLAVPITTNGELYGGILLHYSEPQTFSDEEVDLTAVFGDQVALAIENSRLREHVEQAAAAAERGRLARDLHDSVTQSLFSATLVAEVLPQVWRRDPEEALEGVEELRSLTRSALAEMRTMLLELRPTALLETRLDDLLRQLTEAVTSRAGLQVVLNVEPVPTLTPDAHVTFYRVAQEALQNAVKHAEASEVNVNLRTSPPISPQQAGDWRGQVILQVSDDGQGCDPARIGPDQMGLRIMRERAEAVGGSLAIVGQPGQGTQVTLVWASE